MKAWRAPQEGVAQRCHKGGGVEVGRGVKENMTRGGSANGRSGGLEVHSRQALEEASVKCGHLTSGQALDPLARPRFYDSPSVVVYVAGGVCRRANRAHQGGAVSRE
jgi:hypothetical protein